MVWTSWFCRISFVLSFFDRKIFWITYSTGASFYNITADGIKDLRFLIMVVRVVDFSSMKYKIGNNFAEIYINIPKGNHWILEKKISKDWYNELSKNSFDLIKKGSEKNHYEENLLSYVSTYISFLLQAVIWHLNSYLKVMMWVCLLVTGFSAQNRWLWNCSTQGWLLNHFASSNSLD